MKLMYSIVYIIDPKDTTRKCLKLMNAFNKVARHKINTQKSLVFLYTNDKQTGKENSSSHNSLKIHWNKPKQGCERLLQ